MSYSEFKSKILTKTHFENSINVNKIKKKIFTNSNIFSNKLFNVLDMHRRDVDILPTNWNWYQNNLHVIQLKFKLILFFNFKEIKRGYNPSSKSRKMWCMLGS